jgi:hypothetical protein
VRASATVCLARPGQEMSNVQVAVPPLDGTGIAVPTRPPSHNPLTAARMAMIGVPGGADAFRTGRGQLRDTAGLVQARRLARQKTTGTVGPMPIVLLQLPGSTGPPTTPG